MNYSGLPTHMQAGAQRYMEFGIEPGSFLMSVFSNDFMGAVSHADDINQARLADYAIWLYNSAPPASYGSREKVRAWMSKRRAPSALSLIRGEGGAS